MRLKDKATLITGATAGIGEACAKLFAREGAKVLMSGRDQARGDAVLEAIRQAGGTAEFVTGDLRQDGVCDKLVAETVARYGRIDVLVNNAGILYSAPAAETTDEQWSDTFAVNVTAVFQLARAALKAMIAQGGGSIVNLSSIAALMGTPHVTAYGASKGGVRQVTKSVAVHCARQGYRIRCNSVHPGLIETEMGDQVLGLRGPDIEVSRAERAAMVPMGELGQAADVANVILFLASDESRYVTGAELVVDGGTTIV